MKSFKLKNINILIVAIAFCFSFFGFCSAAVLYLDPDSGEYSKGDVFIVNVRIDTEKECVNVIEANLKFSQDALEVIDFSEGNSILSFWIKKPEAEQNKGLVYFSGGVPAGYCGEIPGSPGKSNLLAKIIFKVKDSASEFAELNFLDNSQVFLNDGFGTLANLNLKPAKFSVNKDSSIIKREWQQEIDKDFFPPEPFGIQIDRDISIFNNQYFIIFSTTDKQTGIAYYEVKEGKNEWKRAESPYLLEDQELKSIIRVRAVDKAGNESFAEYHPEAPQKPFYLKIIYLIIVILTIGVCYWFYKRKLKK